jgi:hypothetical protein
LARSIIASYWARARLPDGSAKNWSTKSSVGIAREMPGVDGIVPKFSIDSPVMQSGKE